MWKSAHILRIQLPRFVRHYSKNPSFLVQCLPSRTVLRLKGPTVAEYLQGLITNDMKHLIEGSPSMFAMFLNTKGRILYDSIIYRCRENDVYFVECDAQVAKDLQSHLQLYKVRRKISIDLLNSDCAVWSICCKNIAHNLIMNTTENLDLTSSRALIDELNKVDGLNAVSDPRVSAVGLRVVAAENLQLPSLLKQLGVDAEKTDFYRSLRLKVGIGEGVSELPVGNCFPLEANCDYLHGVSFHKGCYIGQEVTARTYHTGVIRKRLMPLMFEADASALPIDSAITADAGKAAGKLRGTEGKQGLGLLRVEEVLKSERLKVGELFCQTWRPFWWPSEAPKERPG